MKRFRTEPAQVTPTHTIRIVRGPQGKHLALLPVEPQIGKALVLGCMLGCLDPVLTIAALLSQRNPFVMPMSKKEQADQAKRRFAQVRGEKGMSVHQVQSVVKAMAAWSFTFVAVSFFLPSIVLRRES